MKKIFIHIGAHKSASSTLQANVRNNQKVLLEKHNLSYLAGQEIHSHPLGIHFMKLANSGFKSEDEYKESLVNAKDKTEILLSSLTPKVLISWEGLLGHSSLDKYQGIYTHHPKVSESLKFIFSEFQTRILLIPRRQDEFIESCYLQQIKENRSLDFDEFTRKINTLSLSWFDIANSLESSFPKNVCIIPFETIKEVGTKEFISLCLSSITCEEILTSDFTITEQVNPSFSMKGVELSREILPSIPQGKRKEVNKLLFTSFSSNKYGKATFFSDFNRKAIKNLYLKSNTDMLKIFTPLEVQAQHDVFNNVKKHWL